MTNKIALIDATQRRHLAYDHVQRVAAVQMVQTARRDSAPLLLAVYIARGRPDKWQQWTKSDHRRRVQACQQTSKLKLRQMISADSSYR